MSKQGIAVAYIGYTKQCKDCSKAKGTNCQWRKDDPGRTGCPQVYWTLGNVITHVLTDTALRQRVGREIVEEAVLQCEQWQVKDRNAKPHCDACDDTGEVWAEVTHIRKPYDTVYLAPRPCPRCAMGMFARLMYQDAGLATDLPRYGYGPVDDPHFFTYDARGDVGDYYEKLPEPEGEPMQDIKREMKRIDGKLAAAGE